MSKNLAFDTLNMMDLFGINPTIDKNVVVLHIPHSSTYIPNYKGYNITEQFNKDQSLLTDWYVDKIFDVKNTSKLTALFSRMFCDVERLPDEFEQMYDNGHGFFYTNYINGDILRTDIDDIKNEIYNKYYLKHHDKLNAITNLKLDTYGKAIIIDCHSFNDEPLIIDDNKEIPRPDICIGTNSFHTPDFLIEIVKNQFINSGYNVQINNPYSGTMIPSNYLTNPNVYGIMIEINKKLYMKNNEVNYDDILILKNIISALFS